MLKKAPVKWAVSAVFGLLALGALAFGVVSAPSAPPAPRPFVLEPLALRPFPTRDATPTPVKAPEKTPEKVPEKPAAVVDAGVAPAPAPVVVDAGVPAKAPAPAPVVVDAGVKAPAPVPVKAPEVAPVAAAEGAMDLTASEAADVFVDNRKVGSAPVMGLKVRAGNHKVRFDCYDAAGNTTPGQAQVVAVTADETASVEFTCPKE